PAGGLMIIGTERHESRRIDNQLRGRAGRQGDRGASRFYISLEDDLMRLFGSERIKGVTEKLGLGDDEPIESKMVSNAIEQAQKRVEGNNFDVRKNVLQYDNVMNKQRQIIYGQRSQVLEGENFKEHIVDMIKEVVDAAVDAHLPINVNEDQWDYEGLINYLSDVAYTEALMDVEDAKKLSRSELVEAINEKMDEVYATKEEEIGENIREIERVILLRVVDTKWMDHIDAMDKLKQGIGLRAYRQKDPAVEYRFEGMNMFEEMIFSIKEDTVRYLYRVQAEKKIERERVAEPTGASHGSGETAKKEPRKVADKAGRNDLCTCGSGKKFKNCCGKFQ
ncbi:MAG: SEC-C metal-binding domain-containing protein, partial [Clostridium sp.]